MANINDYLRWRGDLKIDQKHPFNDVDAMILARVSYLPFYKIKMGHRETLRTIAEKMWDFKVADFCWPEDYNLIRLLGTNRRFRNMRVTDFRKNNDKKIEKQFSAVTIHINRTEMYVSYFGTDDTIVGWKEDFNLAILDVIPAQVEGASYLKKAAMKYPFKTIRVGGHSKGGNVAMYAAIVANDAIQYRIKQVYNFDGPGLKKNIEALDTGDKILNRIHSFVPQDSLIGRLFDHTEHFTIVESIEKNVMQHDIYSWKVMRNEVVETNATKNSIFVDKTVTRWIASASQEEREIFVNGMFNIFAKANVNTPLDIMKQWYKYIPTMVKAYRDTPKERREVILAVWKKLGASFMETRSEQQEYESKMKAKLKDEAWDDRHAEAKMRRIERREKKAEQASEKAEKTPERSV